jgi:hypothetical protein
MPWDSEPEKGMLKGELPLQPRNKDSTTGIHNENLEIPQQLLRRFETEDEQKKKKPKGVP